MLLFGAAGLTACGTVDLGSHQGALDLRLDENFYYCVVQPQLIGPQKCATGGSGDPQGGCHAAKSAMRLVDIPSPVQCVNGKPVGMVSANERANYSAAALRVSRNIEASALLTRPTGQTSHPRKIFDTNSPEADIIRQWIKGGR